MTTKAHRGKEMELDLVFPVLVGDLEEGFGLRSPGVVDEHIGLRNEIDQSVDIRDDCEIGGNAGDLCLRYLRL
jgi:hypothetical protein